MEIQLPDLRIINEWIDRRRRTLFYPGDVVAFSTKNGRRVISKIKSYGPKNAIMERGVDGLGWRVHPSFLESATEDEIANYTKQEE